MLYRLELTREELSKASDTLTKVNDIISKVTAKEIRLRKQLDLLKRREADTITIEEVSIKEQERTEGVIPATELSISLVTSSPDLALFSFT